MKKLLIIFILFLSHNNFGMANTTIVFVDLDKILRISKPGASILKQLNDINEQTIKNFKKDEKDLKEKETKIISQKNIISEEEFKTSVSKLKLEINEYNINRKKTINKFEKLKIENTNKFLDMIKQLLIKYSDEKSISLILLKKNLIIGKTELDITDEIIKNINTEINDFKIK